jgi:endonuclease YncB( thermonuclease family)
MAHRFKKLTIPLAIIVGFVAFGLILRSEPRTPNSSGEVVSPTSTDVRGDTEESTTEAGMGKVARVTFVVDGDTVELEGGERVRLIGIDTPERGKSFYGEAREALAALVLNKTVRLERDISERDRYGRFLAYLYLDEMFVNLELVQNGFAKAYTYPPDVAHAEEFVVAEGQARKAGRGLWGTTDTNSAAKNNAASVGVPPTGGYEMPACATTDCDCGDFISREQAQWFHDTHNPSDAHRLDRDKDGRVCETLP